MNSPTARVHQPLTAARFHAHASTNPVAQQVTLAATLWHTAPLIGPSAPSLCSARPRALLVRAERRNETVGSHTHPVWRVQVSEAPAKHAPSLKTVDATKLFREGTVFFGFGIPNVYMGVVGHLETAKVDARSLYCKPTQVMQTRGNVQSGVFIVPRDLPQAAVVAVVQAASVAAGSRDITCVATNTRILADAGFTLNGGSMRHTLPHDFLRRLLAGSLEYRGTKVPFDVVRTTPMKLGEFVTRVERAVWLMPLRHMHRACDTHAAMQSRALEAEQVRTITSTCSTIPSREGPAYTMYYSTPSRLGGFMRNFWGAHPIVIVVFPPTLKVDDYLPQTLKAFDNHNPSFLTRIKRDVIFCRPVQKFLCRGLAKHTTEPQLFREDDVPDMINPNEMHNVVLTTEGLKFMSNKVWLSAVDWVLSKHVLVAGKKSDVRFAGELWKTDDHVIHINRNSGTYRPSEGQLQAAVGLARVMFPHLAIRAESLADCVPSHR